VAIRAPSSAGNTGAFFGASGEMGDDMA
jgi:hypothetical protein